eukprot:TRINITY_DN42155_c0_g2_i5.p1 TRINITY_DN42155_c0_g2~~TRINITY_DN42155_c0_g2_i5.p1  ORF type:complete len:243 (-),score=48.39 TRINITY_DN42155_c0_g2_i5:534-1232(-)
MLDVGMQGWVGLSQGQGQGWSQGQGQGQGSGVGPQSSFHRASRDEGEGSINEINVILEDGEICKLYGYKESNGMLVCVLVDDQKPLSFRDLEDMKNVFSENNLKDIGTAAMKQLQQQQNWHATGYRYMFFDIDSFRVQASPKSKVQAVSQGSINALGLLRGQVEEEEQQQGQGGESEILARVSDDVWVIGKQQIGGELFVVYENRNLTSLETADHKTLKFMSDNFHAMVATR